jgi:hypothetical protein
MEYQSNVATIKTELVSLESAFFRLSIVAGRQGTGKRRT